MNVVHNWPVAHPIAWGLIMPCCERGSFPIPEFLDARPESVEESSDAGHQ
jgi:hypothetical protein